MSASPLPSAADSPHDAQALVDFARAGIPLLRAMEMRLADYDGEQLALAAPLAPNVNDKGCAFGGSLASLMTLAGWGLLELALRERGMDCDVFVADSQIRYLAPVWEDFRAVARYAEPDALEAFFATLAARGRARIDIACAVPGADDKPAATLAARFVAVQRRP